jgi:RNA polymerase sigma-70 factor, ECF subfamily
MTDWDAIVEEQGPMVWRTLWRLLANRADVEECFQEAFLGAFQLSQRETIENWPAVLCSLASARAIDRLRKRYRRGERRQEGTDERHFSEAVSAEPGPPERAQAGELSERLRRAMVQLPEKQAEAFSLHVLSGRSHREIAERLDMTENAVGVTVHRARQRLRELLGC